MFMVSIHGHISSVRRAVYVMNAIQEEIIKLKIFGRILRKGQFLSISAHI